MTSSKILYSLVESLRSSNPGDQRTVFTLFYRDHFPGIKRWILNNSGTEEDAEDVFQEGLIALTLGVRKNRELEDSALPNYLFSTCKNLWFKQLRTRKQFLRETREMEPEPWMFGDQPSTEIPERLQHIRSKLNEMGPDCRELLRLFYFERWSMEEIRSHYQLGSVQAAKNKKARCLCSLRELCGIIQSKHQSVER